MFSGRCGSIWLGVVVWSEQLDSLFDVGDHCDLEFTAGDIKVQSHSEELMFLSSGDLHFTRTVIKEPLTCTPEPICHLGDNSSADMADFQILSVPYNGALFSLDNFVGNTIRIVRVDSETTNGFQILDKALAIKQSSLCDAIESWEVGRTNQFCPSYWWWHTWCRFWVPLLPWFRQVCHVDAW